ncbi:MAG: formyltetrahydrofolate deformylase [Rhodocyclaceae bacterium]|nr:formyltetrahydrofolate deformylase [Rhodocyclaceae bacterium]
MNPSHYYTLTASCPDRVGIVARVATFIAENKGWITETSHHADLHTGRYFMRIQIVADSLDCHLAELRRRFTPIGEEFQMDWHITDSAVKKRIVILVSKQEHCLYDILARWKSKDLDVEIPCVISNHNDLRGVVEWHDIPFHHVPVTAEKKAEAYEEVLRLFEDARADVMVLARYMQILSPEMCDAYPGRIINIHHSFLPSFVGAKPYHQAHVRGVKLIGATCHYVTSELDAGPIIEQDTVRIDHGDSPEDLVRYGKDIEKTVLARGLRYHVEDRVLVNSNRTVVFR